MEFEKGSMLRAEIGRAAEAGDERKDRRKEKHADGKADALPECAALAHDKQGTVCRTVRLNRERETVRKPAQHPPHNPTVEYLANILGKNTILLLSVGIHAPSAFPIGSGNHPFPGGL